MGRWRLDVAFWIGSVASVAVVSRRVDARREQLGRRERAQSLGQLRLVREKVDAVIPVRSDAEASIITYSPREAEEEEEEEEAEAEETENNESERRRPLSRSSRARAASARSRFASPKKGVQEETGARAHSLHEGRAGVDAHGAGADDALGPEGERAPLVATSLLSVKRNVEP